MDSPPSCSLCFLSGLLCFPSSSLPFIFQGSSFSLLFKRSCFQSAITTGNNKRTLCERTSCSSVSCPLSPPPHTTLSGVHRGTVQATCRAAVVQASHSLNSASSTTDHKFALRACAYLYQRSWNIRCISVLATDCGKRFVAR